MTLIDHLLTFPNEAAASGVLRSLGGTTKFSGRDEDDNIWWDRSRVDPGISLITADAVWDRTDPENPILITPRQTISGFHVTIALPEASTELERLANFALRVVENRDKANSNAKFHEYAEPIGLLTEGISTDTDVGHVNRSGGKVQNLTFKISPRFLGSDYPVPF